METDAMPYPGKLNAKRDMVVPINGFYYAIKIVPGPLIINGKTTASKVSHPDRLIQIDNIIPAADRWRVAVLVVATAWESRVRDLPPKPRPMECPLCGRVYRMPSRCRQHIRRVHQIDPTTL